MRITSRRNPVVARYRALSRDPDPGGSEVLLEGAHLVLEACVSEIPILQAAVTTQAARRTEIAVLVDRLARASVQIDEVTPQVLAAMSPAGAPSGIVAIGRIARAPLTAVFAKAPQLVLVAVDIQDPGNAGAIVRAADASGATGVVFCGRSADPFGWRALRGAMGSTFRLPVASRVDPGAVIDWAHRHKVLVLATVPREGTNLYETDLRGPVCVLLGGEGPGLTADAVKAADRSLSIPMRPPVESLNVAVAAALVAYEAGRQRRGGTAGSSCGPRSGGGGQD